MYVKYCTSHKMACKLQDRDLPYDPLFVEICAGVLIIHKRMSRICTARFLCVKNVFHLRSFSYECDACLMCVCICFMHVCGVHTFIYGMYINDDDGRWWCTYATAYGMHAGYHYMVLQLWHRTYRMLCTRHIQELITKTHRPRWRSYAARMREICARAPSARMCTLRYN